MPILEIYMLAVIFVIIALMIIAGRDLKNDIIQNPMEQPLTGPTQQINETNRIVMYNNRYFQHQLKKDGKWVLHSLNGPAVYDTESKKTSFFINGIKYDNELQYLVAKGDYENV